MILPVMPQHTLEKVNNTRRTSTANRDYAQNFALGNLSRFPARELAVLTCMDARLQVEAMLGLKPGDAVVFRNSGGLVTEDAARSLGMCHKTAGVQEVVIVHHTDCEALKFDDEQFWRVAYYNPEARENVQPSGFSDLEKRMREQIQRAKLHPHIPWTIKVSGFIYDVDTGRLREVPPWEPLPWSNVDQAPADRRSMIRSCHSGATLRQSLQ
jgi:carbonic anhydrase